jgi:hypothetical protein
LNFSLNQSRVDGDESFKDFDRKGRKEIRKGREEKLEARN